MSMTEIIYNGLTSIKQEINYHYLNRYIKFITWCLNKRENIKFPNSEQHHIIPKSFDGQDIKENLIYLSYREHFIAHYILAKAFPHHIIGCCLHKMTLPLEYKNSHFYEIAKQHTRKIISNVCKGSKLMREIGFCTMETVAKKNEIEFLLSKGWEFFTRKMDKDKIKYGKDHQNSKPIYVVEKSNIKNVKYYDNISMAAKDINTSISSIYQCCEHNKTSVKSYICIYDYDFNDAYSNIEYRANIKTIDIKRSTSKNKILQLDLNGNVINKYANKNDCNLSSKSIYLAITKKQIFNNSLWCKETEYNDMLNLIKEKYPFRLQSLDTRSLKVYAYDSNHNLILQFNSIKEAVENGYGKKGIYASQNKKKLYKDYYWEVEKSDIIYKKEGL